MATIARRVRRPRRLAVACVLLTFLGACQPQPPVAQVHVAPATVTLAYPQTVTLELTWRPLVPLGTDAFESGADGLLVFVHLIDPQGRVERTFDHPFPGPWRVAGEVTYTLELYQSALDPPLPAGTYRLTLGLYQASGRRWPLVVDGPEIREDEYVVAEVEAPDGNRSTPRFNLSSAWLPPEETGHRQTLARRWLGDQQGSLVIWGIERAGEAVLDLWIPELPEHARQGPEPAVRVRSTCGGLRLPPRRGAGLTKALDQVSGHGAHEIRVAIDPETTGERCTVSLAASFSVPDPTGSGRRSILLEKARWEE